MRNRGDRRGLNPRQLEPQGSSLAKKRSNSHWVPSDYEPPDVRNIPVSDGQSVPGTDIQRPTLAKNALALVQAGILSPEEALRILDFPADPAPRPWPDTVPDPSDVEFFALTELLPDGTRRWREP